MMSTTMPQGSPGSLSPEDYASIVAFYLQRSGFASGANELPASAAPLQAMRVNALPR